MQLNDKNILVVGLAKTGLACARFLASRGSRVTVTDMRGESSLAEQLGCLDGFEIKRELGYHDQHTFQTSDLIVVSPGVPRTLPQLIVAQGAGVEIISEIELASRFIQAPMVAITGTNGKTTTTTIIGELFKQNGFRTFVGGNIGNPLIELAESGEPVERVVAEISSFQLEWISRFRPTVAALLNLSEDHLDRYASYREYIEAKLRIFENQTGDDFAVVNADDALVMEHAATFRAQLFPFSRKTELDEGIFLRNDTIVWRHSGREERLPIAGVRLQGVHNLENIMAALACTLLLGCRPAESFASARNFEALHHRMEFVREVNGVNWFEDSKATNVGSVEKALESFTDITLIAGGKDKGGSYAPLAPLVRERVRHLILIGEASVRMREELGALTDTRDAETLEDAVVLAARITAPGGTVLMSPACSSFDMFRDYEERAQRFVAAVKAL
ncbi:MAG: UDP-N-acetylmuramoyl-L-alanine--D-glutamate ligase [Desulfuromonadales bacterium]|nr:UDP-N-acetylmuramoyl-L-alanine--D-glutamate ligase [Desulfuromonadales bacterium]